MNSIEAWEIVGRDLIWFLRWPVLCGLWCWVGYVEKNWLRLNWRSEDSLYPPLLALLFTVFVANY